MAIRLIGAVEATCVFLFSAPCDHLRLKILNPGQRTACTRTLTAQDVLQNPLVKTVFRNVVAIYIE